MCLRKPPGRVKIMCFGIRCVGCTSHTQASCQHSRPVWAAGSPGETAALLCWEAGKVLGRPSGLGVSLESPLGLALRGGVTYPTPEGKTERVMGLRS